MTTTDEMLEDMEEEVASISDHKRGRGPGQKVPTTGARPVDVEPSLGPEEQGVSARLPPPELSRDPLKPPLFKPEKDLRDVPTTLEGVLAVESEGKSANEVLGVLVAAHERRAMAILQRTRLAKQEVITVANLFNIAKHGIGGRNPALNKPIPDISEWGLTILEALPSVEGKSRTEFVEAWQRSEDERRLQRLEEEKRRAHYMGT